jgi:hypothetical protein
MTTMTYDKILTATREALSRRDSRRDVLAQRIHDLASAALDAARATEIRLTEDGSEVLRLAPVSAACSQWANGHDTRTRTEDRLVLVTDSETRSLCEIDLSYHDGRNYQSQYGHVRDCDGHVVRPATVAQLRAVARALPAAIASLLVIAHDAAVSEAAEADAAIESL